MKYKIFTEAEKQSLLIDYYQNKLTIKLCMAKYGGSKSTIIRLLRTLGCGGRRRSEYNNNQYSCDESFFEKIDSHEKAYWFGFICADGNIYKQKLQIGLNKNDENHLKKLCKRINYNGPFNSYCNEKKLTISRKKIVQDLKNLGLIENKTLHIDENIFNKIPKEYLRSAILGYIDGDGCFSFRKNKFVIFSLLGNESFLNFICNFFKKNGILIKPPKKDKRTKQTFYISYFINQKRLDSMFQLLYVDGSEDFLNRKQEKLIKLYEYGTT
jgi:hypothetical protein